MSRSRRIRATTWATSGRTRERKVLVPLLLPLRSRQVEIVAVAVSHPEPPQAPGPLGHRLRGAGQIRERHDVGRLNSHHLRITQHDLTRASPCLLRAPSTDYARPWPQTYDRHAA